MSGLGIGPILTRPSNWVQGVPEWPLPGSEMFFSGMVGCGAHLPTCTPDPPNGPPFGLLWRRIFLAAWQRAWGGYHPLWLGLSEKFHLPKKIFFFTQAGLVCGCRRPSAGLQSAFNQHPPCPVRTNAPWGFCCLKRAPRRAWEVRGSTTVRALSAFQAPEMGLAGDVG